MARGTNTFGDVPIATLLDGTDINRVWADFQATLEVQNTRRTAIQQLFTFSTTRKSEEVAQTIEDASFERASEFGVPSGIRSAPSFLEVGYSWGWFDAATRYTWMFLAEASTDQVNAVHNAALAADNRLIFAHVMQSILDPTPRTNGDGTPVYGLWSNDGNTPPPYDGQTFPAHNHYLVSGATAVDGEDVRALVNTVTEHGYGEDPGTQLVLLVNPAQAGQVRALRTQQAVNGFLSPWDFIPSTGAAPYLTAETLVGERPAESFQGLRVEGLIGPALVVEDRRIPAGYMVLVATGGPNSPSNVVGFREHARRDLQGLRQIPGPGPYPVQNSYYSRGFGVGVRSRGAAAVMQVKASGSYVAPTLVDVR